MSVTADRVQWRRLAVIPLAWRRFRAAFARGGADAGPVRMSLGGYTINMRGIARFDLRDPYHLVVALSWPRFLLTLVILDLAINVGFALLYLGQPGSVAHARPGSLADAFYFSVETSATVGYGEMYPATTYGHVVSTAEIMVGMAFTALMTGSLFVRFSRPRARIRYARNAVIASHDRQQTLMVRIANARRSLLYNAVAHLSLLVTRRSGCGTIVRRVYELQLTRAQLPMFSLTWTLMHRIDASSPLHGYDAKRLIEEDARLFFNMEARDATVGAEVVDMKDYGPTEILFGMRYAEAISFDAEGYPVADLTALNRLERDVGPEPLRSGWQDLNANDAGS